MLKHALAAALVVGLLAPVAQADLVLGQPLDIEAGEPGIPHWGFEGPHPFGGNSLYTDNLFGNDIIVTSAEVQPPPGKKFAGVITIDYGGAQDYMFGFPHREVVDIFGIKDPGGKINFINTVETDLPFPHVITTDGFNIHFEVDSQDIATLPTPHVTITWTQIPAPGTLALLGLAGFMGTRRRRK